MPWTEDLSESCTDQSVAAAVSSALARLLERDAHLFRANVNERTIAHRLAVYLEWRYPDWDVDCEYNRDGYSPKALPLEDGSCDDDEHGSRVYPDIILHKRNSNNNFVVVELKKSNNPQGDQRDFAKLRSYCSELGSPWAAHG